MIPERKTVYHLVPLASWHCGFTSEPVPLPLIYAINKKKVSEDFSCHEPVPLASGIHPQP